MKQTPLKIILFSKIFFPSTRIGAVRPSNFALYLAKFGNEVTVVADGNDGNDSFNMDGINLIRVKNSNWISRLIAKNERRVSKKVYTGINIETGKPRNGHDKFIFFQNFIRTIKKVISEIFELVIEFDWYRSVLAHSKATLRKNEFDIAISSYGPLSSFLLGMYSKRKNIATHWVCDFRDNMTSTAYSDTLNKLFLTYEKFAIINADALLFVSKGQKSMFLEKFPSKHILENKCHTLFNGYSRSVVREGIKKNVNRILHIAYTGRLYPAKSDFKLLFEVLNDLIQEGVIEKGNIRLSYAGQNSQEYENQLKPFLNLQGISKNYGFVGKLEAETIQGDSDILVALAWNTRQEQGILSGKFLEYLKMKKPIIGLTTGNLARGELTSMIEELCLGIACEYCNLEVDRFKLKEFITAQYNLKVGGKELVFNADVEKLEYFDYESISKDLLRILTKF